MTPLLRLAGALPAYSRKTRQVSECAQAIRQALVGRKPLDAWGDADLDSFELQIVEIGRRFRVVERVAPIDSTDKQHWPILRVSIADPESEIWGIVRDSDFTPKMQDLYDTLVATFAKYEPLSIEQKISVIADQLRPLLKNVDVT